MKLTVGVIILFVFQATAAVSQNMVASIHANNMELDRVFSEIEKQTSVKFLYRYENIAGKQVSVNAEDRAVDEILEMILRGQGLSYSRMSNNLIVISPVESMQSKKLSGTVTDESGSPLPGLSIVIKGTTQGTVTDMDGKFNLTVTGGQNVLVFSFIGYTTQEVVIGNQTNFNVVMREEEHAIDEVVVTALGIVRSKKTLTYATQEVNVNELSTNKDINLGNALAGKIAGVNVTASSGASGVSGDALIIIRGNRSISGENQPLVVIDGIPSSTGGGGLSGINTDDVQSINVLKGPSASALYGSAANNGVIVVTTKKGKKGKAQVEFNSSSNFDVPYLYPEFQNEYAQGAGGNYSALMETSSWGPRMTGQTVTSWTGEQVKLTPQPDNVKDLFRTGYNLVNSFSYSVGDEKLNAYFSYTNTNAQGVLEDNKMQRHNLNLRLGAEMIKNLKMDFRITYHNREVKDMPVVGDDLFSPMFQLVKMPRSIRTADIEDAYYYDQAGSRQQLSWNPGSTTNVNPYWSMAGYENPSSSNSINSFLSLRYDFTDWLYLQVRGGLSSGSSDWEKKTYWGTPYAYSGQGGYETRFSKSRTYNGDVLLSFNKKISKDFNLSINLGAEIRDNKGRSMQTEASELTTENKFALAYGKNLICKDSESRTQKQSVYGMGQLSFREYLFLDVTARNDWSSTLPAPHDYFYPSVGLTGIISDMAELPEFFTFAKLRGSYAETGNDAKWALTRQTFKAEGIGPAGQIFPESTRMPINLIPEKSKAWEAGADLRFFDNRLSMDLTWYKSNTYNQLVLITSVTTSGYTSAWKNCGNIQNTGIELMVGATPVRQDDFSWNVSLNFAKNKNKVVELSDNLKYYEIPSPNLSVGETWIIEGKPYGEMYTKGFVRNDKGQVVVDSQGKPKVDGTLNPTASLYLGNFNYDWTSGITNSFQYKNWNMSFLVDLNYGGVRGSSTEAMMLLCGTSKASLAGREDGILIDGVFEDGTPNNIRVNAEEYARIVGGRISNGCGELFDHEATNSRLRELSIGYDFRLRSNVVKSLRVSATGRNLFYIYNGCKWFDPDVSYDISRNGQGAESAFLPGTRTFGFNVRLIL